MISGRMVVLGGCAISVATVTGPVSAETVTYSYDALGRLTASTIAGGPNAGTSTAICMDAAGNRSTYVVTASGAAACTPPPTPPPLPLP